MLLALLFGVLLSLLGFDTPPVPQSVTIPAQYNRVFFHDAIQTRRTRDEVIYCLIGYEKKGHYRVTAVIKPKQRVTHSQGLEFINGQLMWVVRSGTLSEWCPRGTIMSLHTHPFDNISPSDVDLTMYAIAPYPLNGIIGQFPDGSVKLAVYLRDGTPLAGNKVRSVP